MEVQGRTSRSPSVGLQHAQSGSHGSSPPHFNQHSPSLDQNGNASFNPNIFAQGISSDGTEQFNFAEQGGYLTPVSTGQGFPPGALSNNDFSSGEQEPFKRNSISGQRPSSLHLQNSNHQFSADFSNPFPTASDGGFALDPALQPGGPSNQSINPADIMGSQEQGANGQNIMHMDQAGLSPKQSPQLHDGMYSPARSRHGSTLDPATAGLTQTTQGPDWTGVMNAQYGHRRAPSEHSDVSSVGPSPYLKQEGFEPFDQSHSPLLNPQQDSSAYHSTLGMERFTISEQNQPHGISPRMSPYPSPRMSPHQPVGLAPESQFILGSNDHGGFPGSSGPEVYPSTEPGGNDLGIGGPMEPPSINVTFAPTRQLDQGRSEGNADALSPPSRGRNRLRAKSDPMSRPLTPGDTTAQFVPLDPRDRQRSLSPFDHPFNSSRDVSPAGSKSSRRSSTSSIPNRDYILDLADPSRTPPGDHKHKIQKHPATFQCSLCPKRFTRAYNLRSHLRTHTDERPFVCTVCGKAFARQHDRKRHEGLHSGEKKFVCKGELSNSGQWGCGRRFARADALGRHFRSEAGRVCIKPLLDEEAAERQRMFEEQMMSQQGMHPHGMQVPPPQTLDVGGGGFTLPAALLAQYPALQGLQWDQLGATGPGQGDDGEISGRSSFDASSAGEFYDDEGEGSGYVSGPGTAYGSAWAGGGGGPEWASDYEGR